MNATLRPVRTEDNAFLFQVYASTRSDEMALVDWTGEQKEAFLRMQFNAQTQSYRSQFPEAMYRIILHEGVPAGRLIVDRSNDRILLIDIALLPPHRNRGIGGSLIRNLQAEAQEAEKPLQLHVETFNPAFSLYESLGFKKLHQTGVYWALEWRPKGF